MKAELVAKGRLNYDSTNPDEIRAFFEPTFERKQYNPLDQPMATEALAGQIGEWRRQGSTVVFVCGVYDLFHANHRTFLLHTKVAAAPHIWDKSFGQEMECGWEQLDLEQKRAFTKRLLENDCIKLVVSVDGNAAVAASKGFNAAKGNCARPVYDWTTRARDVLSAGYELEPGKPKLIADAVTIHDAVEPKLAETPHRSTMAIAEFVGADVWCLFDEAKKDIETIQSTHKDRFGNTDIVVLSGHNFYSDALLQSPFSTTSILGRIAHSVSFIERIET